MSRRLREALIWGGCGVVLLVLVGGAIGLWWVRGQPAREVAEAQRRLAAAGVATTLEAYRQRPARGGVNLALPFLAAGELREALPPAFDYGELPPLATFGQALDPAEVEAEREAARQRILQGRREWAELSGQIQMDPQTQALLGNQPGPDDPITPEEVDAERPRPPAEAWAELRAGLAANRLLLDELDAAWQPLAEGQPWTGDFGVDRLPEGQTPKEVDLDLYITLREIGQLLLAADAHLAAAEGRADDAVRRLTQIAHLAAAVDADAREVIISMVATQLWQSAAEGVMRLAPVLADADPAELARLRRRLLEPRSIHIDATFHDEVASMWLTMQAERDAMPREVELAAKPSADWWLAVLESGANAAPDWPTAERALRQADDALDVIEAGEGGPLATLVPLADHAWKMSHTAEAHRRLALLGLAIAADGGADLPDDVAAWPVERWGLPPETLIDPMTAKPFRLARPGRTATEPWAKRLRLYSVGRNEEDDGGRPPTEQERWGDVVLFLDDPPAA
jgi:hypothetical protein